MVEKATLFEADIKMDQAIQDTLELKTKIKELSEETKAMKGTEKELSEEYIRKSAILKGLQQELKNNETIIQKVTTAEKENIGTVQKLEAQNAALRAEQKKLILTTDEGVKKNKEIVAQINKNTQAISQNSDQQKKGWMNVGQYGSKVGEATSALGRFVPGIGAASSSMKTFGVILKVALGPIGLIIAAIGAMIAFFKRSEEGQNSLAKVTKVFTVVLNNFLDVVGKIGEALFNAITKPKEAWQKFKDFVHGVGVFFQNTFGNVIGGSIEVFVGFLEKGFAKVGVAWQKLKGIFIDNSDKIAKAQEKVKDANDKITEGQNKVKEGAQNLGTAVKNAYDKAKKAVTDFIAENQREIEIAKRLADQQAALDKQIRANLVQEAKDRAEIAKLRTQAADKENVTAEERLKLLQAAIVLEEKILQRNLNIASQKYEIKKIQNSLSASTKQDLDEEAQLRADLFREEEQSFMKRKELASQISAIQKEISDAQAKAAQDAIDRMNEAIEKEKELLEKERLRKLEALQTDYDNQLAIAEGNLFATLELERQGLEMKRQQEIEAAESTGANVQLIKDKYRKANEAIDKAETDAKLEIAAGFSGNLASIFGQNTAIGKAAAVASTTIDTYKGAQAAFAAAAGIFPPPVWGIAAAAAAVAAGLANVKKILAVKSGLPGDKSISAPGISGGGGSAPVAPTAINPQIGQGIVSRQTIITSQQTQTEPIVVLPVDEVTLKQQAGNRQTVMGTV